MASMKTAREFVNLMKRDDRIGVSIGDTVLNVTDQYGGYLIVHRKTGQKIEVSSERATDLAREIYNAGSNAIVVSIS